MPIRLGPDDLSPGEVRIVPVPQGTPPKKSLLLVRSSDGLRCYWNVCMHLPVPLDGGMGELPNHERLVCLTHGAEYEPEDGACVAGPCEGAQLEAVAIEVVDGQIFALL